MKTLFYTLLISTSLFMAKIAKAECVSGGGMGYSGTYCSEALKMPPVSDWKWRFSEPEKTEEKADLKPLANIPEKNGEEADAYAVGSPL